MSRKWALKIKTFAFDLTLSLRAFFAKQSLKELIPVEIASGKGRPRNDTNVKVLKIFIIYLMISVVFFVRQAASENQRKSPKPPPLPQQEKAKDSRAELRAFYSAPPVIPHEIESRDSKDCLRCHLVVTKLEDGRVGSQTPHPQYSNCLQCHAPGKKEKGVKEVLSTWQGLEEPKRGSRALLTSPPTVPHRIFMRENCLSCHGPQNPNKAMRTTHPERTSCLQCHVPNADNEF